MNKIMKYIKKFRDSDDGVAGVLIAILLIGLFISGIAFIQTVYVPQWMEQKESEHMGHLANQFSQLKFSIDTLSVTQQPNSQISIPITLGSDELPFLSSSKSYGSLNILPNDYKISIKDKNGEISSYKLGSIKYESTNAYFMDQSYVYENGALLLSQYSGDVVAVRPSLSIEDTRDLSFNIIKLSGIGGKTSVSGYGTYPIQTKFLNSETSFISNVQEITIYNSYIKAWKNYFNDTLSNSALNYSIDESNDGHSITITFYNTDGADFPELFLNVIEIEIQISTGWTV